jgi:hypothetical protein
MSRKIDIEKYIKVVNSCQNPEQLLVAQVFGQHLYSKYGESFRVRFWIDSPFFTPFLDKLIDIQNLKAQKLKHEKEMRELCQ